MDNNSSKKLYRFRGFEKPKYTPVPDEVFDELLSKVSGNQLKVLMYIIRRTFGFQKDSDNISINQMLCGITKKEGGKQDRGVGLSKPTILQCLRDLTLMGIIIPKRRQSSENGDEPTNYRLNILGGEPTAQNHEETDHHPVGKNSLRGGAKFFTTGVVKKIDEGVVKEFDPQETILQDTVNNVNVERSSKNPKNEHKTSDEREAVRVVTLDILSILKDEKSRGFYLSIARRVPSQVIYRLLAEIRADIINNPHTRVQNPAAIFTKRIKEIAAERGIKL
jgi:hypothetical protein